ncbi:MAG: hypothetical protein K1X67_19710 [Fimbriimonadaceae bacterium]|nr:hypothetical protein [Fimbriimonadaceae bacterium]
MQLTRRMRLIWQKLWLIPLVGATSDVVASEAAKLGGVTVPISWLFSAIGVAGMLGAAVVRAYSIPLIPEGLETPDEALTRRSRVLGERLGATPVRVFVCDLPKLRGNVDTFLDGHDLFVSERVAEMPEAERDFVLARALVENGPAGTLRTWSATFMAVMASLYAIVSAVQITLVESGFRVFPFGSFFGALGVFAFTGFRFFAAKSLGACSEERWEVLALEVTGDLRAATAALLALNDGCSQKKWAVLEAYRLEKWWDSKGQKVVEASEWYRRERSLAAKGD